MSNAAGAQKQHRDAPLRTPGAASAKYRTLFDCPRPLYAPLIYRFTQHTRLPVSALEAATPAPRDQSHLYESK